LTVCDVKSVLYNAGLRLLAIGRNQYIDTMNQCRSSKVHLLSINVHFFCVVLILLVVCPEYRVF